MRDISFLTHYVLTGSFSPEILRESNLSYGFSRYYPPYFDWDHSHRVSRPINFSLVQRTPEDEAHWNYYSNIYNIFEGVLHLTESTAQNPKYRLVRPYSNLDYFTGDPNYSLELSGERASLGPWSHIIEARSEYHTSPSTDLHIEIPYYKRLSSSDLISQPQITYHAPLRNDPSRTHEVAIATLEMQRHLLNLGDPLTTLAYFSEHPDTLREKRWQVLFKAMIFQPELLLKEFKKTPTLPRLLSDFTWLNFESRMREEDYATSDFFARMHQLLEEFTQQAGQATKWPKDRIARKAFQRILVTQPVVSDLKSLILRDVIRTYRYEDFSHSSWQDMALFIEAVLYRDRNALEDIANFEADEENSVYGIYQYKRETLSRAIHGLDSTNRNSLMNHVINFFRSHETQLNWTLSTFSPGSGKENPLPYRITSYRWIFLAH